MLELYIFVWDLLFCESSNKQNIDTICRNNTTMPFEKISAQPLPESPFRHAPLLRFALLAAMGILLGCIPKGGFLFMVVFV